MIDDHQTAVEPSESPEPSQIRIWPESPSDSRIHSTTAWSCGGCPTRWRGLSRAHCAAEGCHQTFANVGLFDLHRRAGACLDPATLVGRMRLVDGIWTGPPMTDEQKAAKFGRKENA